MGEVISEGNHVVLMKSFDSGNMKIVPAASNTIVHYGKLHFDPSPLIGSNFGSVFEIKDGTMSKVDDFEAYDDELSATVSEKSTTFNLKSQFSQEKLIKKKKKQNHANVVTVVRPSLILINEMLYARDKIGGLRMDTLAQILTSANIQNGSKCLLLDHNLGIVTSALMSRILPDGVCIQLMPDLEAICTTRKTLQMLNINDDTCSEKLLAIKIRDIYKVSKGLDSFSYEDDILRARCEEHLERLSQSNSHMTREQGSSNKITSEVEKNDLHQTLLKKEANRQSRNKERLLAATYLKPNLLDSIVLITQNDHPLTLLRMTFEFLAPSRQFVVYSDSMEPLLECYQYLKSNSLAVCLSLSESWLRKYQVLPNRTRPEMNMTGYGGYLLSGTKVCLL